MKKILIATTIVLSVFGGAPLVAQEQMRLSAAPEAVPIVAPATACPHPFSTVIKGEAGAPTPDAADFGPTLFPLVKGSQWNQTAVDKAFGTTFHFPAPSRGECCLMTKGTLVVKLKALQGGPANGASSSNDDIVVFNGSNKFYNKRAWTGPTVTGGFTTHTVSIPQSVLATGFVSLYVEDDTAVVSAVLSLEGCCLK